MKKLFVSMVLGLVVLLGGVNLAYAEDVYVGTFGDLEIYIDNNQVRGWPDEFTCRVGIKNTKQGTVEHTMCAYVTMNGMIMGGQQGYQNVVVTPNGQPAHWAVYKAGLRYLKHIAE